ncbi:hypothetical protein WMF31_35120 [Sorangium sp. So ce1036]|uniref:hypothetical protein n=1 Tax=Sorangium sp. So ce1036 TaxID=3133328 RepID=UPI003F10C9D6
MKCTARCRKRRRAGSPPAVAGPAELPRRWVGLFALIGPVEPEEAIADAIRGTVQQMRVYLEEVIASRRRALREDLVSELLQLGCPPRTGNGVAQAAER